MARSVRIYKIRAFERWARKEGIDDSTLCVAIDEIESGLVDAVLGSGLVKKRAPATGRGKRGGVRLIIGHEARRRSFFLLGFAKNERDNTGRRELVALKKLSDQYFGLSDRDLAEAVEAGALVEVKCDE